MVKIRLKVKPPRDKTYSTPKGHSYTFLGINPLEISDKEDIEYFKNKDETVVEGIKEKIEKIILPEKKEPKYTEKQLFAMNKSKQLKILKELGVKEIPKLEKDRVNLILKLSG